MPPEQHILLLMSGSIACAKATQLISNWTKAGHQVQVATTSSVRHFVGKATLEGLSGLPIFDNTFGDGQAMDHIRLAQEADLVVACPASANLISRFANGIADDAVSTLWQAAWGRRAPQVIVPAMNTHMWNYPATQENLARLKEWGVHVFPTDTGELACGEQGAGRMMEPDAIQERIEALLNFEEPQRSHADQRIDGKKILVTGGGTREPIDSVRYIGNHSSGRTAATLVDELASHGHQVTWLGGMDAIAPKQASESHRFDTFSDLDKALKQVLSRGAYDAVIHAAAVSDFSVAAKNTAQGKLSSDDQLTLELVPNPKLLGRLRDYADNPELKVVGFKLTAGADSEAITRAVAKQFNVSGSDLVVHNDFDDISAARHSYALHRPNGGHSLAEDSVQLADALAEFVGETS